MSRPASLHWNAVCIDCNDAEALATFYGRLLGWEQRVGGGGWVKLVDPTGGVSLNFQAEAWYQPPVWPEQRGAQDKMLHFEIRVDGGMDAAVADAVAAGAKVAEPQPADRDPGKLRVLLDPAGHPFCLWAA